MIAAWRLKGRLAATLLVAAAVVGTPAYQGGAPVAQNSVLTPAVVTFGQSLFGAEPGHFTADGGIESTVRVPRVAVRTSRSRVWELDTIRLVGSKRGCWSCKCTQYKHLSQHSSRAKIQAVAKCLVSSRWSSSQWAPLKKMWTNESHFNPAARNRSSGACGIPQAHPCYKIKDKSVWGQIRWGLGYISGGYNSPQQAWQHWQRCHSY